MISNKELNEIANLPKEHNQVHLSWLEGGEELGAYKIIDKGCFEKPEYDFIKAFRAKYSDIKLLLDTLRESEYKEYFEICLYF